MAPCHRLCLSQVSGTCVTTVSMCPTGTRYGDTIWFFAHVHRLSFTRRPSLALPACVCISLCWVWRNPEVGSGSRRCVSLSCCKWSNARALRVQHGDAPLVGIPEQSRLGSGRFAGVGDLCDNCRTTANSNQVCVMCAFVFMSGYVARVLHVLRSLPWAPPYLVIFLCMPLILACARALLLCCAPASSETKMAMVGSSSPVSVVAHHSDPYSTSQPATVASL
jgi:hypothetical protein